MAAPKKKPAKAPSPKKTESKPSVVGPDGKKPVGGQVGHPGPTGEQELEARVRQCKTALENHWTKGEIKQVMRAQYGVDARTVERYLSRAREQLLLEVADSREFYRSQSLSVYRRVLRDEKATLKDRMFAQRQIDHLLGLHAPWKVAQTDTDGKDVIPADVDDRLSALASRIADRVGNAGVVGGARGKGSGGPVGDARGRKGKAPK